MAPLPVDLKSALQMVSSIGRYLHRLATQLLLMITGTKPVWATRRSPQPYDRRIASGILSSTIPKIRPGTNTIFTTRNTDRIYKTIISQSTQSEEELFSRSITQDEKRAIKRKGENRAFAAGFQVPRECWSDFFHTGRLPPTPSAQSPRERAPFVVLDLSCPGA